MFKAKCQWGQAIKCQIIQIKHNEVKNPNWQERLTIVVGCAVKLQLVVRTGIEPATSGLQIRRPNHSATLPPITTQPRYRYKCNATDRSHAPNRSQRMRRKEDKGEQQTLTGSLSNNDAEDNA